MWKSARSVIVEWLVVQYREAMLSAIKDGGQFNLYSNLGNVDLDGRRVIVVPVLMDKGDKKECKNVYCKV